MPFCEKGDARKRAYDFLYKKIEAKRTLLRRGGDKESRTLDPLLARQVLSQLSYTPTTKYILSYFFSFVKYFLKIKTKKERFASPFCVI